eukprot:CAMPEP_0182880934 /NCGR_PEP_ID=MMETSP0034_2-20130328/16872_1 /TAXON_ID=156128 /ORGANISM="Nephroselmis pyriformis, Strain CCMP717" /LENGTH=101 /DNA_ID=CAMNT_0025013945 /DNA_START=242 /DNA_END=547 /DNA_ORIENTATION=+
MGNAIGAQAFVDGQLAANTHFTKAEVHALHGAFSGGHTMLLDKEAFKALAATIGVSGARAEALFPLWDTNQNGVLDFKEFVLGLETLPLKDQYTIEDLLKK